MLGVGSGLGSGSGSVSVSVSQRLRLRLRLRVRLGMGILRLERGIYEGGVMLGVGPVFLGCRGRRQAQL